LCFIVKICRRPFNNLSNIEKFSQLCIKEGHSTKQMYI
jgi:hypothetical protein